MLYMILGIVFNVALIVHVLKTGRATLWIYLIILVPLAGGIAYLIVELLPELMGSKTGRKAVRKLDAALNPDRELNQALAAYEIVQTTDNALRLANAYMAKNEFAKARDLYAQALRGLHAGDPYIMFCHSKAEFGLENYGETKRILDELIVKNPEYKNPEAHLLFARTLELLGNLEGALHEYETLDDYYPGPEASYRYANLLTKRGQTVQAQSVLRKILVKAKTAGAFYREMHKEWIRSARSEYQGSDI